MDFGTVSGSLLLITTTTYCSCILRRIIKRDPNKETATQDFIFLLDYFIKVLNQYPLLSQRVIFVRVRGIPFFTHLPDCSLNYYILASQYKPIVSGSRNPMNI